MAGSKSDSLGLYISIPFCRSKCTYCNFASGVFPASEHTHYVERLLEDLKHADSWAEEMGADLPRTIDTIYFGGGTPSLLEPALIARLFAAIRAGFNVENSAEITVECAPGQLADEAIEALVRAGVDRVSLGVQSFVDREAHVSGRLHNRLMVLDDLRRLRAAGITNLNIDLIAGLAGQTFASWDESVGVLIETDVPHASIYMLEVDVDSRLGRELLGSGTRYYADLVPTDDAIARMYETAIEKLERAGLRQYEISNFAQRGFQARHNLRYWERRPYLGVGLDASSALRAKDATSSREQRRGLRYILRSKTTEDMKDYLSGPQVAETAWLSPARQQEEAWFLGLRLNGGVKLEALKREFGLGGIERALTVVEQLARSALVVSDGKTVRLTARGRMVSNDVFQEFLFAAEPASDLEATGTA
jgi:putative oxygen-independent coproporphyrinogen III oxidase